MKNKQISGALFLIAEGCFLLPAILGKSLLYLPAAIFFLIASVAAFLKKKQE